MGSEITDEQRELAAGYALGLLDDGEARSFEQLLASRPDLAIEVASFQEVSADIAFTASPVPPPPGLKSRLMAGLSSELASAPGRLVVRQSETDWVQTPFTGVQVKRLFVDPVTGMITTLLRAAAGAVYPAHEHGGVEQVYVVDGDMIFDDHSLDTGDYEVASSSTRHSSIRTTEGCLAVIIHSPDDKVFPE